MVASSTCPISIMTRQWLIGVPIATGVIEGTCRFWALVEDLMNVTGALEFDGCLSCASITRFALCAPAMTSMFTGNSRTTGTRTQPRIALRRRSSKCGCPLSGPFIPAQSSQHSESPQEHSRESYYMISGSITTR